METFSVRYLLTIIFSLFSIPLPLRYKLNTMIKGLFFIFLYYFLGEMLSRLIGGFMPGSVLGMILLFLSLLFKVLKPSYVKDAATVITKNMAVFFVPAGVGLMSYWALVSQNLLAITSAIVVSTIAVIATVALLQQRMEKTSKKGAAND